MEVMEFPILGFHLFLLIAAVSIILSVVLCFFFYSGIPLIVVVVGFITGIAIGAPMDQRHSETLTNAFEEYYSVTVTDGTIPYPGFGYSNGPNNLELYFEEDGALLQCQVSIVFDKYTGFCEDGRTL